MAAAPITPPNSLCVVGGFKYFEMEEEPDRVVVVVFVLRVVVFVVFAILVSFNSFFCAALRAARLGGGFST